ncbi:hypothetical protein Tco_0451444 [Tanacetum coccineum]
MAEYIEQGKPLGGLLLLLPQILRPEKSDTVGGHDDTSSDKENLKKQSAGGARSGERLLLLQGRRAGGRRDPRRILSKEVLFADCEERDPYRAYRILIEALGRYLFFTSPYSKITTVAPSNKKDLTTEENQVTWMRIVSLAAKVKRKEQRRVEGIFGITPQGGRGEKSPEEREE